jgi:hypothetical protein
MLKHFSAKELVPPSVYDIRGDKSIQLFDTNALKLLDWLRDRYGSATVNDWAWSGNYSQSGLRTVEFYGSWEKYNKSFSQHKYGRAFDVKFKEATAQEIREDLKAVWAVVGLGFPITLEDDVSWLHVDTRWQERAVTSFKP